MKFILLFSISIFTGNFMLFAQSKICADSSIKVNYFIPPYGAKVTSTFDTLGFNIFSGSYYDNENGFITPKGTILMRADWDKNVLWAKKIPFIRYAYDATKLSNGDFLLLGEGIQRFYLIRFKQNGTIVWIKEYLNPSVTGPPAPNTSYNRPCIAGNFGFLTLPLQTLPGGLMAKIDLNNGNIIWSKEYRKPLINDYFSITHILPTIGDTMYAFLSSDDIQGIASRYFGFMKFSASSGEVFEVTRFVLTPFDTDFGFVEGIQIKNVNFDNASNSISIAGIATPQFSGGNQSVYFKLQNTTISNSFRFSKGYILAAAFTSFNKAGEPIYFNTRGIFVDNAYNYLSMFDNSGNLTYTKIFKTDIVVDDRTNKLAYEDDWQNIHVSEFDAGYSPIRKVQSYYTRFSNSAIANTLDCYGKDTSLFVKEPLEIKIAPFGWDEIVNNVLVARDFAYTEEQAVVNATLICKEVSICDSIKILGPTKLCVNQEARFTLYKNPLCKKYNEFIFDNTMMQVIRREADSAIVLKFTQPYRGKLNALLRDCVLKDSIDIEVTAPTLVKINPLAEKLCPGKPLPLSANSGLSNYTWSNGTTGVTTNATQPGWLLVVGADNCGNLSKDSVFITAIDTSFAFNSNPAPICNYDSYTISIPNNVTALTWAPNSNTLRLQNELSFFPPSSTLYTLQATHAANCNSTKTINLKVNNCPTYIYFPNAFTPNGDGLNDDFKPKNAGKFLQYQLRIYNRYGQVVFSSNQPNQGWSGTLRNSPQPIGSYVWECSYQLAGANLVTKRGMVNLIR